MSIGGFVDLRLRTAVYPQNPSGYTGWENTVARLAIDQAVEALVLHPRCQEFFSGNIKGFDPVDVLKDIDKNNGFKRGRRGYRDDVAWTLALGRRSRVYLYDQFFEPSVGGSQEEFWPDNITTDQARALTILHEFAHAIGRNVHAFGGMSSQELDRKIFDLCFNGGKQPLQRGVAE